MAVFFPESSAVNQAIRTASELFDLRGKIALVTGASRGICAATSRLLAAQGAHVIVASRKMMDCATVVQSITSQGGSAEAVVCHMGDADAIAALFATIDRRHERLDILVNNAATNPYYGHVLDADTPAFQKTADVNIRGYFLACSAAGRLMRVHRSGAIVNNASISGLQPGENQGIYSITKAAILSMTKVFARECGGFGIRVNAIAPGLTKTRFAEALFKDPDLMKNKLARIPLGRPGMPEEIAAAVLYLACDAASYVTGECIVIDGGYTI